MTAVAVVLGGLIAIYLAAVILMYTSPTFREMVIYLHPCKLGSELLDYLISNIIVSGKINAF